MYDEVIAVELLGRDFSIVKEVICCLYTVTVVYRIINSKRYITLYAEEFSRLRTSTASIEDVLNEFIPALLWHKCE